MSLSSDENLCSRLYSGSGDEYNPLKCSDDEYKPGEASDDEFCPTEKSNESVDKLVYQTENRSSSSKYCKFFKFVIIEKERKGICLLCEKSKIRTTVNRKDSNTNAMRKHLLLHHRNVYKEFYVSENHGDDYTPNNSSAGECKPDASDDSDDKVHPIEKPNETVHKRVYQTENHASSSKYCKFFKFVVIAKEKKGLCLLCDKSKIRTTISRKDSNTNAMRKHLLVHHPKAYKEFYVTESERLRNHYKPVIQNIAVKLPQTALKNSKFTKFFKFESIKNEQKGVGLMCDKSKIKTVLSRQNGSTSGMKKHLLKNHPNAYEEIYGAKIDMLNNPIN